MLILFVQHVKKKVKIYITDFITCSIDDSLQQKVFGCPRVRLEFLTIRTKAVVAYARKTVVDLDV